VEYFGPALELVRTGSPYVAGFSSAVCLAGIYLREVRRHFAAEALTRQERYDELKARHDLLLVKCDAVTEKWLTSEQEKAALLRGLPAGSRKAGDS
jgi:hypothetical protein